MNWKITPWPPERHGFDFEKHPQREVDERKRRHLEAVRERMEAAWRPCMHDSCPSCYGTGVRHDGSGCVHMISCPCPRCSPVVM